MRTLPLIAAVAGASLVSAARITTSCSACTDLTNSECLTLLNDYVVAQDDDALTTILESMSIVSTSCVESDYTSSSDYLACLENAYTTLSDTARLVALDTYCASTTGFGYTVLLDDADGCASCIGQSDKKCLSLLETSIVFAESQQLKAKILRSVMSSLDDVTECEGDLDPSTCAEKMLVTYTQLSDKNKLSGLKFACSSGNMGGLAASGNSQASLSPLEGKSNRLRETEGSLMATSNHATTASEGMTKTALAAVVVGAVAVAVGAAFGLRTVFSDRREYAAIPTHEPI